MKGSLCVGAEIVRLWCDDRWRNDTEMESRMTRPASPKRSSLLGYMEPYHIGSSAAGSLPFRGTLARLRPYAGPKVEMRSSSGVNTVVHSWLYDFVPSPQQPYKNQLYIPDRASILPLSLVDNLVDSYPRSRFVAIYPSWRRGKPSKEQCASAPIDQKVS